MIRFFVPALLLLTTLVGAQNLGRADRLWRDYLSETVRRGLPLLNTDPDPGVVPFWPSLDRARADAASLEPSSDVALLGAWADLQEGSTHEASQALRAGWPTPAVSHFSRRQWAQALFSSWDPKSDPTAWTQAWLAWDEKAYSVAVLVRGLEVLEREDTSAVVPLLSQAVQLYPEDRRLLPLVLRHPGVVATDGLLARDLALNGGWSAPTLASLLTRQPASREVLARVGYSSDRLDAATKRDYGTWLNQNPSPPLADGRWTWDADQDGHSESSLTAQGSQWVSWTRSADAGVWTLTLAGGQPQTVVEARDGAVWTLRYEAYPWAKTLEYRWANSRLVYRFRPLAQAVPLWPEERFTQVPARLPAALSTLWVPVDVRALAQTAASVETWDAGVRTQTVYLFQGEVWLEVEDSNHDGRDDTWSYFRSGQLTSVYRDTEGRGQASLRELYRKGELNQVQSRAASAARTEFALFPNEGVQLWDPASTGKPLDRVFVWSGDRLQALVFSGPTLPWETMPPWEPKP